VGYVAVNKGIIVEGNNELRSKDDCKYEIKMGHMGDMNLQPFIIK
jgi:hypothetical protein